jgi:hypothetical protein
MSGCYLPAVVGLVEAEKVLRAGFDGFRGIRLPGVDEHVTGVVKHGYELAAFELEHIRATIADSGLPVVAPATLCRGEQIDLSLGGFSKSIAQLAAATPEDGRRCLSESGEPSEGDNEGGRNHIE